jgi:hypothetical protein
MFTFILALLVLAAVVAGGLYIGVVMGRDLRAQFDELLPQRMVDFSGFVDTDTHQH